MPRGSTARVGSRIRDQEGFEVLSQRKQMETSAALEEDLLLQGFMKMGCYLMDAMSGSTEFFHIDRSYCPNELSVTLPATGDYLIAVDAVQAGAGETVLVLDEGNGGRQVTRDPSGPVRAVVVGVVDDVRVVG